MKISRHTLLVATIAAACAGCSKHSKVSDTYMQDHPAPEMFSTADRGSDAANNFAYMRNTNYRGFVDDWNRAWLIDNPMRLSPFPIVDASGNPR